VAASTTYYLSIDVKGFGNGNDVLAMARERTTHAMTAVENLIHLFQSVLIALELTGTRVGLEINYLYIVNSSQCKILVCSTTTMQPFRVLFKKRRTKTQ
jgi:hypothetical protein